MDNTENRNEVKEAGIAMGDEVAHGGPNEEAAVTQADAPDPQVQGGTTADLVESTTSEAATPQSAPEVVAEDKANSVPPPNHSTIISEDDRAKLRDLVDMIVSFGNRVAESRGEADDEEEEEGAVQEDEVPFERIPQTVTCSNIVHLLNIPPEIDMEALATAISSMADIILHSYVFKGTQLKIVFVDASIASEARQLLDGLRLHNRVIQVVLSTQDDANPLQPPQGAPTPRADSNAPTPRTASKTKHPHKPRGAPRMAPAPPVFKLPPLPPRLGRSAPPMNPSHRGPPLPIPLLPPGRFPDAPERLLVPPMSSVPPLDPPSKIVFGRNLHKLGGMSLFDMLSSQPQVCNWSPDQSVEEQQRHFDKLYEEFGTSNRYLLLGKLPESATETISAAREWLSRYTQKKPDVEICRLEQYAADLKLPSDKFLHITFQRRADCTEFFAAMTKKAPEVVCRFSCPRTAYDTIWVGNVTDILSYCRGEEDMKELFARLGEVKACTFTPEKGCFFVTYASVEDSIRARNRLLGALFSPVKAFALNVDFTLDVVTRYSHRGKMPLPGPRGIPVSCLPQKLGERLLSALQRRADGNAVIRQLLDGRDSDAVDLLTKGATRGHPKRPYDGRPMRAPTPKHPWHQDTPPWPKTRKRPHQPPDQQHEQHKYRKSGPSSAEFGPVEQRNPNTRGRFPRRQQSRVPADRSGEDHSTDEYAEASPNRPKSAYTLVCNLLKRSKPICKVSSIFLRGDISHRVPQTLDVNQRANPERLVNCLQKTPELSLWKMVAESEEDNERYDSLCEYLLSKNRVAIVQDGPYEIYIVPPAEQSTLAAHLPDTQSMYAFVLPKGS
ncbi:hypothetical protein, conserved [Babesia bigemina]|uniref:RRM domain-containing protein n=1 Tax=Babesia bigemina TaxID=5866 RepID=A0A061DDZ9_BABBI|nr:hypothetical protein, conserved [Babesia bigemina]CDR97824.1 hypothetical protein, conserved [Babesia bigemina]|eukprot:XP_012770010.1 hypothetical protein, conserved [Babesia bigemina]